MPFYAYILKSSKDNRYYENLEVRLAQHNAGRVKATKSRRPFVLHYYEEFPTKLEANRRELFFKSIDGYLFLKSKGII